MNLYNFSENFVNLKLQLDAGEITEEQFKDTVESFEMDSDKKAEDTLKFYKSQKAELDMIAAEKKRLSEMEKTIKNRMAWLQGNLETYYRAKHGDEKGKQKYGTLEMGIKSLPAVVDIVDEMELPDAYITYEPKTDKMAIKKRLQDGEVVPGATLNTGRLSFYVK